MIRILPNWYGKVEEEIKRTILKQANELNIPWIFIHDSKAIDDSLCTIMNVLLRLKENVRGEFDEETLKNFKKIGKSIKEEEIKKDKSKVKRVNDKSSDKKRSRKTDKKIQKRKKS